MTQARVAVQKLSGTFLGVLIFLLLGLADLSSGGPTLEKGSWSTRAPASIKRTEVAVAALGGKIYVVGGFSAPSLENIVNFLISPTVEVYDPVADTWSTSTPLPVGLHHAGIATLDERLYVIGGFTKSFLSVWHPVATVYRYDPRKDKWTELASMPTARGALGVTTFHGRLYAIGGFDGTENPSAVEVFDPNSNTWSSVAPLPTPRDHLAVAIIGSRIFAIGGRPKLDYGRNMGTVEEYDPIEDQWHTRTDMPTPRSGITAGVIDEHIYVLGGESSSGTFATNEVYSPQHNTWRTMTPMPTARHGLGSAVIDQRLFVISGGTSPGGSFSNKNEMFTPPPSGGHFSTRRSSPAQVGAVMALLAVFQDANALPPETSPKANQLIHALIQFQAVVMKSPDPTVHQFVSAALEAKLGDRSRMVQEQVRTSGITYEFLEALIDHTTQHPILADNDLRAAFKAYNLRAGDWELLQQTVNLARLHMESRDETLSEAFARRRQEMPGRLP